MAKLLMCKWLLGVSWNELLQRALGIIRIECDARVYLYFVIWDTSYLIWSEVFLNFYLNPNILLGYLTTLMGGGVVGLLLEATKKGIIGVLKGFKLH